MTATDISPSAPNAAAVARARPRRAATGTIPAPSPAGRTADGLSSVSAQAWDRLIQPGSVPLKHRFLTAWETSELPGLRSRPVLAQRPGEPSPVGACPAYFYDLDLPSVRSPRIAAAIAPLRRLWSRLLIARTYELGSPTPLVNPFLVADQELRPAVVPAMLEAALEEAEAGGAEFVLVQNFTSCGGPAGDELRRLGFACFPGPAAGVVDLPYSSFDEYLDSMRAQYRRRAQKTIKRTESLRVEHLERFDHLAEELARLWRCIYDRAQEIKREVLTPAFFAGVSEVDEVSVLLTRREDDSIASFALLISDEPWLSFVQCGFEEDAGRGEGAYFRLLYEIVRHAIERGYRQVDLGITTLPPKLDVGAVPVQLYAWLRHRNPLVQRAIRGIASTSLITPEDTAARRVFKDGSPSAAEIVEARRLEV